MSRVYPNCSIGSNVFYFMEDDIPRLASMLEDAFRRVGITADVDPHDLLIEEADISVNVPFLAGEHATDVPNALKFPLAPAT